MAELKYIAAAIATICFLGTAIGQGLAVAKALEATGRNPAAESKIRTLMFIGCAVIESTAIYGLVVSLVLLFVV